MTEKDKMLGGELYDASDPELVKERIRARLLLKQLNDLREDEPKQKAEIIQNLLPNADPGLYIQPPFFCDYGYNIHIGENVFFNFNCIILDVNKVTIGKRTLFGPNVQIYTATHPLNAEDRATGLESGKPITIGDDVWIGGSVVICPGVIIGEKSVIGAGSVVTKDIPPGVLAAGNPCRILKQIN